MSKRYRISAIALGLSLIFSVQGLAQSHEESVENQTESSGQGETSEKPAASAGFPVRILEYPEEPESAKRQQQESEEREIKDLIAQQGMADSTEKIVWLTALQFVLATIGTIALVYSILLNRRATQAAIAAVGTERAWMTFNNFEAGPMAIHHDGQEVTTMAYKFTWENTGRSPAGNLCMYTDYRVVPITEPVPEFRSDTRNIEAIMRRSHVGAGRTVTTQRNPLDPKHKAQADSILVYCWVQYSDLYSNVMRTSEICGYISFHFIHDADGNVSQHFDFIPRGPQNRLT